MNAKQMNRRLLSVLIAALVTPTIVCAAKTAELAEERDAKKDDDSPLSLDEILVTASTDDTTVFRSSVSVTVVEPDLVEKAAPRSTAEIFRNIPGIRSESSGGEGNANIAVRGLPVAAGGAKFLQLHEDGLPVMEFGDIAFANADIFLRYDYSVERIEAIRGGSASTFASNSPGGVINFISRTGETDGGSLALTTGVGYESSRGDFEYGGRLGDDWRFHVGGFWREGDGPRNADYRAESGGQIKGNLTREFEGGYARLYFKHLNDRAIGYLPMPVRASGSNDDPDIGSLPGFDPRVDTPHSPLFLSDIGLDGANNRRTTDIRDGMRPKSTAVGAEFSFDLDGGWSLLDRFRFADKSGRFVSPFPAEIAAASAIAAEVAGAGATVVYANGPNAGQAYTGTAIRTHLFNTELNDFGSFTNDLQLKRSFDVDADSALHATLGYYLARQDVDMDWVWNSYLMELRGRRAALLDIRDARGALRSDRGLYAYGVPFWGNCCTRSYDVRYDVAAPYVSLRWTSGPLDVDGSVRFDSGEATGNYAGSTQATNFDVDGDGTISGPERNVSIIDNANPSLVDYDWDYTSWSLGANYVLDDDLALFGRASRGGRANADRLLFGRVRPDGSVRDEDAVDQVDQFEFGAKWSAGDLSVFATAFLARTDEQNFEATTQRFFDRSYEARGLELEAVWRRGGFWFSGGLTLTDAEITEDNITPENAGNTPRRQPDVIYQLTPQYTTESGRVNFGANIVGQSDTYASDANQLVLPGFVQVNLFASYRISDNMQLGVNVNNAFDALGLTESEEGAIVEGVDNIIRARPIPGRTVSATLRYEF